MIAVWYTMIYTILYSTSIPESSPTPYPNFTISPQYKSRCAESCLAELVSGVDHRMILHDWSCLYLLKLWTHSKLTKWSSHIFLSKERGSKMFNFCLLLRHERPSKRKNWQDHSTIISGRLKFLDVRIQRFQPLNGHLGSSQPQRLMPPRRPRPQSAGTRSHRSNRSNWGGPSEDGHKGQEGRGSHRFPSHQSNHDEESEEMSMSAQRPGPRHGQGPDGPVRRRQIFEELWNRLVRPLGDDVSWSIVWKLSWLLCLLILLCVFVWKYVWLIGVAGKRV